jgi:hypothetical protein
MKKMKATGWKKMKSTPRISQEMPLNLRFVITTHHDTTKFTEALSFCRRSKINTHEANPQKVN